MTAEIVDLTARRVRVSNGAREALIQIFQRDGIAHAADMTDILLARLFFEGFIVVPVDE